MNISGSQPAFDGMPRSTAHVNFSNRVVTQNISTRSDSIQLTNCQTDGILKTMSGHVKLDQGELRGRISTRSGEASINGAAITGNIETMSGDIALLNNASVMVDDSAIPGLKTTSGAIAVRDSNVRGNVETQSGKITLMNSTVHGDVSSRTGSFSIDRSTVTGTLTAIGESLHVGDFSNIDRIVLQTPQVLNVFEDFSQTFVGGIGTNFNAGRVPNIIAGSNITITSGSNMGGSQVIGNVTIRGTSVSQPGSSRASRIETQTVFLGAGTKVRSVEFDAARCRLVLGPDAEYSGPQHPDMTIEREINLRHSTAQALDAGFRTQTRRTTAASSSVQIPRRSDAPISESIQLPDARNYSLRAHMHRMDAVDKLLDTPIATASRAVQESDTSSRRAKMGEIGTHFIEGLQGETAKKLRSFINWLDDGPKAKTLAAIIYGTLFELELTKGSDICKTLEDLCKKSIGLAGAIKDHIEKIDGAGIRGSALVVPVSGGVSILDQPDGRLPYATQMMLDALGLR